MRTPLQVTYRGIDRSDALDARIYVRAAKLERFHPRITSCRVVLDETHSPLHHGRHYHVRIELRVPGAELVVENDPFASVLHQDIDGAIDHVFDIAKRQLEDHVRRQRAKIKALEPA